VFVKKSYLISWVFAAMQSVHIRMNSSLTPPKNPGSAHVCTFQLLPGTTESGGIASPVLSKGKQQGRR